MSSLADLQQCFQGAILSDATADGFLVPRRGGGGFSLYANAYRARLVAALRDNYPVLAAALGDELFEKMARDYLAVRPSRYRSIRWFGDALAAFLDRHPELVPHPALADLARMDWALRQSFDAADDEPLRAGDLAMLVPEAWPEQRFVLRAAVCLLPLSWRVEPIWQALSLDPDGTTDEPVHGDHYLLVWRPGQDCCWRSLDRVEAAGLQLLASGATFSVICENVMAADIEATATAGALMLKRWVDDELLLQPS